MSEKENNTYPLAVDLDGTLIRTDLFFESFLLFIKKNPLRFFLTVYWFVCKGGWYLKSQLEEKVPLNIPSLPWNVKVLDWLREQKENHRKLVLVTGSNQKYAEQISNYLDLFSDVFGTCKNRPRLTGMNKARFLIQKYGVKKFDYIGNSAIDFHVWKQARKGIVAEAYPVVYFLAKKFFCVTDHIYQQRYWMSMLIHIVSMVPWVFLLTRLFFLMVSLLLSVFFNIPDMIFSLLHVNVLVCLLFFSAFILGELLHLYQDRIRKYSSLFLIVHPYWGVCVVPLFLFSIWYMVTFVPISLWILMSIYCILEYFRFLFRPRAFFYEVLMSVLLLSCPLFLA